MNGKTLLIAGVVAVVVTGAAVVATRKEAAAHAPVKTSSVKAGAANGKELLFPALKDKINDIAKVQIEDHTTSSTLVKVGDSWGLEQKSGFPAKFGQARELVLKLSSLEKLEKKTSNKESFSRIDLEDITAKDAKSKQVTLWDDKGTKLGSVILGKINYGNTQDATTQFVRVPGENQTWLAKGQIFADAENRSWLESELVAVPADRIQSAVIEHAVATDRVEALRSRPDEKSLNLITVPEGRTPDDASKIQSLTNSLQGVRFDDVVKTETLKLDSAQPTVATFTTFDGLVVKASTYKLDGKDYTTIAASVSDARIAEENKVRTEKAQVDYKAALALQEEEAKNKPTDATPAATPTPVPEPKPELVDVKKVQEEADKINKKHGGWAFVLPSYVLDRFTRKNDYFLKEVKAEDLAGPQKEAGANPAEPTPVADAPPDVPVEFKPGT